MFLKNSSSFRPEPTPSQQPKKRKLNSKTLPHNNPKARWRVQIPSLHSNAESKSSGQNIVKIQKLIFKIDFQINFKINFKTIFFYLNS